MKRCILLLLALLSVLALQACGNPQQKPDKEETAVWHDELDGKVLTNSTASWSFRLATRTEKRSDRVGKEKREVASGMYEVPYMEVDSSAGAPHSSKNGDRPAEEAARKFNHFFEEWLTQRDENFQEISAMAAASYKAKGTDSSWEHPHYHYVDDVTTTFWRNSHIVCVLLRNTSFTGGAHEIVGQTAYTFDLRTGKMVNINDMVEDYAGLRSAVTDAILSQTERMTQEDTDDVGFFSDYREVIPDWMSRNVYFGPDSLTVLFSVYDIAPYAAGEQAFEIPYTLVKPYLNDYGCRLLEIQ